MIHADEICSEFEECVGWPYESPGVTSRDLPEGRGIDCSGLFVRSYKLHGKKIYHGSNTIWREYLTGKGKISSADQLRPGMAVFKWLPDTPSKFNDGLGDFCHIGLVTSVSPLRIVHASTDGDKVRVDSKLGKKRDGSFLWKYWGMLKGVSYPAAAPEGAIDVMTPSGSAPLQASGMPTIRFSSRGDAVVRLQMILRAIGYELEPDGIFGSMTREAVKTYQATHELQADGIVGPMTWAELL